MALSRRAVLGKGVAALTAAFGLQGAVPGKIEKLALKIAATTAPQALAEFVRQTGFQVLFDFDAIRDITTHEVSGQLDPGEALSRMFEGSGLTFEFINDRTISVRPRPPVTLPVVQPTAQRS
jgi:hypothetical protein